ncbi:hypothetical protein [Streptomyces sp. NPDC059874]|uniref:hypothetical protein n=1 Tax=Streptomyces sp. NPDC059874 TaxID=3346983 RepID=UPI003663F95B
MPIAPHALRQRAATAAAGRSRDDSTGHSQAASHPAGGPFLVLVAVRLEPTRSRVSLRCRLIRSACRPYAAHAFAGTFTC